MRSCALRILEAETISSARVTLRVFCTLLILVLISLPPAIVSSRRAGCALVACREAWVEPALRYQVPVALKSSMPFLKTASRSSFQSPVALILSIVSPAVLAKCACSACSNAPILLIATSSM